MIEYFKGIRIKGRCFSKKAPLEFFKQEKSRLCIVYGKNGSGKSTISKSLQGTATDLSLELMSKDNCLSIDNTKIYVFNEEFIRENIDVKYESLDPVILFGEQVAIDKKIEEKQGNLEKAQKEKESIDKIIVSLSDPKNSVSYKYKNEKLKDHLRSDGNWLSREIKIKGKNTNITESILHSIFESNISTPDRDTAVLEFDKLTAVIASSGNGKIIEILTELNISKDFFIKIQNILSEQIEKPILSERDKLILEIYESKQHGFINFIKNDFISKDLMYCPYCFRSITDNEKKSIIDGIEKVLSENAQKHENELKKIDSQVTGLIASLDNIHLVADKLKDIYTQHYEVFDSHFRILNELLAKCSELLQNKVSSLYIPIKYDTSLLIKEIDEINHSILQLETDRQNYNISVEKIEVSKKKALLYSREIAYWEFIDDYNDYKSTFEYYNKLNDQSKVYEKLIENIIKEIDELNNQKKNVDIAKDHINTALNFIFMASNRLKVEVENGKYLLISNGKRVTPEKVSMGERNIIALCYFFTKILNNHNSGEYYTDECLIMIDDPISSFDFENIVGVITYLKYQISRIIKGNENNKIVVMTHDLSTVFHLEKAFSELSISKYGKKNKHKLYECYELCNNHLDDYKENRQEYTNLMEEIFKYANGSDSLITDFTIGNSLRRLLEAFSTFVYRKCIEEISTDEAILELCKEFKGFYRNYMYRLVLNNESHFQDRIKNLNDIYYFEQFTPEQLKDTTKKIICFLYLLNPLHIKQHLQDIKDNYEEVIKGWLEEIPKISDEEFVVQIIDS